MEENDIKTEEMYNVPNIDKEVNILQDDRQTTIRIPKEIVNYFDIKKGDKFRFLIEFPDNDNEEPKLSFEVKKNGS